MTIDPKFLPPKYQAQVAEKHLLHAARANSAATERAESKSKYHNIPDTRSTADGRVIRFASRKEARRYDELMLMLKAGEIRNMKLQPEYTLQEAYTTPEGERVKAIRYRADFSYERGGKRSGGREWWEAIVEDVKGRRTDMYKLKKKLMLERLGIEIVEV